MIVLLSSIFSLVGCGLVNSIRLRNSNDHLQPVWPEKKQEVVLGTHYLGEKPYVDVSLNGETGFRFLVDTGASITILMDTPKIKALKLKPGYKLPIAGWGDEESSQAFQTKAKTLGLSGIEFKDVNVAFVPTSSTKYFLDPTEAVYDGVLGHDILHHFSWLFDKKNNRIVLSQKPFVAPAIATTIPFDTFFSKINIEGEIDFGNGQKIDHEFIIDTGSRHYLKVATALVEGEDIKLPGKSITAVDFGMSGRTVHQRVTVPQLDLAGLKFPNVKTNLIGGDFEDDFSVLGSALFNQFVSVIDYHSDKMYLVPYPDQSFRTKYNLLGLELRKLTSGDFIVRFVFPDMVSAKHDFKEGDLITSINGKKTSEISLADYLEISATPEEYQLCRKRKSETCITVESQHFEGYSIPDSQIKSGQAKSVSLD